MGVVLLVVVGGFLFGWLFARAHPLPASFFQMEQMAANLARAQTADATPGWSMLPKFTASAVLLHNLRATVLSLGFALFSFGALSLLLAGLPMSIIGFLTGQIALAGNDPWHFLLAFVAPHALVELPATVLATAFALRLGAMLIAPPNGFTAGEALLLGLSDFFKVFLFLVLPLLLAAAVIEIYGTPWIIQALY